METRKLQLLLHPITITALVILLVNDFYWKYEYQNLITGKLSDIAGLFLLTIFLTSFFYSRKNYITVLVGLFFIWWKSPLSKFFIDGVYELFSIHLFRTIDYTDYLALPVVLIPYYIRPGHFSITFARRLAMFSICILCMFSFCATSYYRKYYISPDFGPRITFNNSYNTSLQKKRILERLDSLHLNYKIDSFTIAPLRFHGGNLILSQNDSIENKIAEIKPDQTDTSIYFKIIEHPYIAVYNLAVDGEVIPQVNFSIREYSKSNTIHLESIILEREQINDYYEKMSKTKRKFRKLTESALIKKLQ